MADVEGRLPGEIELAIAEAGEGPVVATAPSKEPTTPREWIKQNLFSNSFNSLLTIVFGFVVVFLIYQFLKFVFVSANWEVARVHLRVYMIGRFPIDEAWRVWTALYFVLALVGLSWGYSGKRLIWTRVRTGLRAALAVGIVLLLLYLLESAGVWILLGAGAALFTAGVVIGRLLSRRLRRPLIVAWIVSFPLIVVILRIFDGPAPSEWGGLMLNVMVAAVGIFASFPLGILLALGRRSSLRIISMFCVGFIELFRGAPLVMWLVFGRFVLLDMFPPGVRPSFIVRAMVMFTIFSSAYVAEIVRGGIQGVHSGQYEAGRALGLSVTRLMALIILPQALRSTIPAMISHFISLFKDTALLAILGFTDVLEAARRAANPQGAFSGTDKEALLVAALIFFGFAISMGRWSQRLERRLGVGER